MWNNNVNLAGNLTADVELKKTESGKDVCNFTIAVAMPTANKETSFFHCSAWGSNAKYLSEYGKKGCRVILQGYIRTRSYEVDDQKRTTIEVVADSCTVERKTSA